MGFKRTSDGRVFFQGADEPSNQSAVTPEGEEGPAKSAPSQLQVLSLLKSLNERLKTTQAERNYMRKQLEAYREVIEVLEDKSDKNEQSYAKLEKILLAEGGPKSSAAPTPTIQRTEALMRETLKEMGETRRLLVEIEDKAERANRNTSSLQKMQQDQAQKMARTTASYAQMVKRLKENENKQDDFSAQLEDTVALQAKMARQIDKVAEDRARFMRKIERIEETVIQTRDALNAKAMVLLTDQGAGDEVPLGEEQTLGHALLQQQGMQAQVQETPVIAAAAQKTDTRRQLYGQVFVTGTLLVAAVLFGWAIGEMKPSVEAVPAQSAAIQAPPHSPTQQTQTQQTQTQQAQMQNWSVERDTAAFAEDVSASAAQTAALTDPALGSLDDIGTISVEDDRALLELVDENPDAVAAALNGLEPGVAQTAPVKQAIVQPEVMAPPPAPVAPKAKAFDPSKYTPVSGSDEIQPDASLPDVIKQVEEQAFAGVPEAQHDLAAIYTAGHAGVRQDYNRAGYWFRKAADQGIANARYNLGVLHHQGLGVRPNMKEAIYWYDQASMLGHPEAQYNLGIAYIEGIGVPYSPTKAADNFEKAANGGVMEAAYNLGLIHENGLLGQPKPDEALKWYKQAADQGSPEAKTALEQLAQALDIKLEDVNRLVEGMQKQGSVTPTVAPARVAQPIPAALEPLRVSRSSPVGDIVQAAPPLIETLDPLPSTEKEFAQITLAQVQEQLMNIGLYPGPADGILGPLTIDAIRSYQAGMDLPVNGQASTELLSHMLSNGAKQIEQGSRE